MAETPQQSRVDLAQAADALASEVDRLLDHGRVDGDWTDLEGALDSLRSALRASTEQGARVNPRPKLDVRGFPWCVDCGERTVLEPRCPDCSTPRRPESAPPDLIERLIELAARCMTQEDVWTCAAAASEIRRLRPQGSEQGQVPARAVRAPEQGG